MYYLQNRYYDPVVKRMLSADDESLTAGATLNNNLFSYCDNNPVNRADIDGEVWHIVAGAVAGMAIETLTCLATGEKLTMEGVLLAGTSGAISAAFGFLGGWPSSAVGRYITDVAVGVASDTMAYMFNGDISDIGSEVKKSVKTNVVSVAISRSAGSVGKAIGRRFSKASHNSITKAAKKSHSTRPCLKNKTCTKVQIVRK